MKPEARAEPHARDRDNISEPESFEVIGRRRIPPDPGILKAIGLSHGLDSAIADLVDNSVDADASHVWIRFVLHGGQISEILVLDNGKGMNEEEIDEAMKLGRPKENSSEALGHFGVGLKSASFSQASLLTVMSKQRGNPPQGRRMSRESRGRGFECEILSNDSVRRALDEKWLKPTATGTIVLWEGLRNVPQSRDPSVTNAFIEDTNNALRHHLGLIFHRLLQREVVSIAIDVLDADLDESGLVFGVEPINPFAYAHTGAARYPKTLLAKFGGRPVALECHIWPGGSDSQFFKLFGAPVEAFQGFFLYRNDRLISAGGWGGVVQETKRRKLARVAIDIDEHLDGFTMSMEKTRVRMAADLVHAIDASAATDGATFHDYLARAEEAFRESNKRVRKRPTILPPGIGIPPRVKRTLARELNLLEGEDSLEIRWERLPDWAFLEVDREQRVLWLNSRYRKALLKGVRGGVNDVPLIKTLLFLLYEDIFRGAALGAKDKDVMSMWQEILTAAAEVELREFGG